jgi:hypothetical protein
MTSDLPSFVASELRPNQAMTIFVRHVITQDIVDCYCVGATTQAAMLLGYPSADDMHGIWLSKTQTPETGQQTRQASILRHYGIKIGHQDIPSVYVCDVLRPDGSSIEVVKNTSEIAYDGKNYWVTLLEDATGEKSIPNIKTLDLPAVPPDAAAWAGKTRIADIETLFSYPSTSKTISTLTTSILENNIDLVNSKTARYTVKEDKNCFTTEQKEILFAVNDVKNEIDKDENLAVNGVKVIPVDFSDAHTLILEYGGKRHYIFWCRVCDNFFRSLVPEPRECTNRGCKSKAWSTLDNNSGWLQRARKRYSKFLKQ